MNIVIKTEKYSRVYQCIKLLVFDMAGTTVDEGGIVYKTLFKTMNEFDLEVSETDIHKWHGSNKYEVLDHYLMKKITSTDETIINSLKTQLHTSFNENLKEQYFKSDKIKLIDDGIPELFNKIRSRGIKIALNTGYNKDIQKSIIEALHMDSFLDDYISSEEVKFGRPYPYMIHKLMERHNIESGHQIIKFGDSKNDILEGLNANCRATIGVLSGADNEDSFESATHIIRNVMDIDVI
jgi:phosphonatase-like hydrolase